MRKAILWTAGLLLCTVAAAASETHSYFRNYDLNTPTQAATANRVVTSVNFTNNTTFTVAAQPDVPRNITMTVTDTTPSIVAGTLTVSCKDVNGVAFTDVLDLSTGLTYTGTKPCATVVSVVSAGVTVLGGAGDETVVVGTGSVVGPIYCVMNDPVRIAGALVKTTGLVTTVTSVATSPGAFDRVATGDSVTFFVGNSTFERTVSAKASNVSITVDSAVDLSGNSGGGYPFAFQHPTCGYSDSDGWINTGEVLEPEVAIAVNALSATGGVAWSIECRRMGGSITGPIQVLNGTLTAAVIPGVLSSDAADIFQVGEKCASVRVGLKFGTTDTSGTDSVSADISWQTNKMRP